MVKWITVGANRFLLWCVRGRRIAQPPNCHSLNLHDKSITIRFSLLVLFASSSPTHSYRFVRPDHKSTFFLFICCTLNSIFICLCQPDRTEWTDMDAAGSIDRSYYAACSYFSVLIMAAAAEKANYKRGFEGRSIMIMTSTHIYMASIQAVV